ncbi:MAG: hypothetical protein HC836_36920 [Richelia sp. RM2_1_2]|nr:hypothetical protein [Richelia sp. RM2_1_2]
MITNNLTDRSVFSQRNIDEKSIFRFAVNSSGCNKDWDFEKLATGYEDKSGTLEDVVEHVTDGHAIAAGLFGGKRRCKANVIGTHWILGDIDNSKEVDGEKVYDPQLTIEQALQHPFIKKYCGLIYTSASHTDDWHRFRLVFMLPEFVEGCEEIEQLVRFMMAEFPFLDPTCKDASRVFYGNTRAELPLINPDAVLPVEWVHLAKEQSRLDRIAYQARCEELRRRKELYPNESKDTDSLVMQALSFIPPRQPGSGNYEECTKVAMALVSHFGESEAERIIEDWSPSIPGDSWNVSKKVGSYKRSGVAIGTLFHVAKRYGFKFPSTEIRRQGG